MIKKCCGNDVAAFAKLSVVEKEFFVVATYWR